MTEANALTSEMGPERCCLPFRLEGILVVWRVLPLPVSTGYGEPRRDDEATTARLIIKLWGKSDSSSRDWVRENQVQA